MSNKLKANDVETVEKPAERASKQGHETPSTIPGNTPGNTALTEMRVSHAPPPTEKRASLAPPPTEKRVSHAHAHPYPEQPLVVKPAVVVKPETKPPPPPKPRIHEMERTYTVVVKHGKKSATDLKNHTVVTISNSSGPDRSLNKKISTTAPKLPPNDQQQQPSYDRKTSSKVEGEFPTANTNSVQGEGAYGSAIESEQRRRSSSKPPTSGPDDPTAPKEKEPDTEAGTGDAPPETGRRSLQPNDMSNAEEKKRKKGQKLKPPPPVQVKPTVLIPHSKVPLPNPSPNIDQGQNSKTKDKSNVTNNNPAAPAQILRSESPPKNYPKRPRPPPKNTVPLRPALSSPKRSLSPKQSQGSEDALDAAKKKTSRVSFSSNPPNQRRSLSSVRQAANRVSSGPWAKVIAKPVSRTPPRPLRKRKSPALSRSTSSHRVAKPWLRPPKIPVRFNRATGRAAAFRANQMTKDKLKAKRRKFCCRMVPCPKWRDRDDDDEYGGYGTSQGPWPWSGFPFPTMMPPFGCPFTCPWPHFPNNNNGDVNQTQPPNFYQGQGPNPDDGEGPEASSDSYPDSRGPSIGTMSGSAPFLPQRSQSQFSGRDQGQAQGIYPFCAPMPICCAPIPMAPSTNSRGPSNAFSRNSSRASSRNPSRSSSRNSSRPNSRNSSRPNSRHSSRSNSRNSSRSNSRSSSRPNSRNSSRSNSRNSSRPNSRNSSRTSSRNPSKPDSRNPSRSNLRNSSNSKTHILRSKSKLKSKSSSSSRSRFSRKKGRRKGKKRSKDRGVGQPQTKEANKSGSKSILKSKSNSKTKLKKSSSRTRFTLPVSSPRSSFKSSNASSRKSSRWSNASSRKSSKRSNASSKKSSRRSNASSRRSSRRSNASSRRSSRRTNASSRKSSMRSNASSKKSSVWSSASSTTGFNNSRKSTYANTQTPAYCCPCLPTCCNNPMVPMNQTDMNTNFNTGQSTMGEVNSEFSKSPRTSFGSTPQKNMAMSASPCCQYMAMPMATPFGCSYPQTSRVTQPEASMQGSRKDTGGFSSGYGSRSNLDLRGSKNANSVNFSNLPQNPIQNSFGSGGQGYGYGFAQIPGQSGYDPSPGTCNYPGSSAGQGQVYAAGQPQPLTMPPYMYGGNGSSIVGGRPPKINGRSAGGRACLTDPGCMMLPWTYNGKPCQICCKKSPVVRKECPWFCCHLFHRKREEIFKRHRVKFNPYF